MIILRNGISYFFKLSRLGFALILIFTLMPLPSVEAARPLYCTVGACEGLDPNSTGCDEGASTVRYFTGTNYRVELRRAATFTECVTKWVRTQNTGSVALYAGARYWVHTHLKSSPAPIAPLARIYTSMHYPSGDSYYYCGKTASSYVNQPMGAPCAGPA